MPTVLPSSPDTLVDGLQFFLPFWLPVGTYSPSVVADLRSHLRYFHLFMEDMFSTPLIRHAQSKTVLGGYNGAVQLVCALIMYLLNFAAVSGEFTPPHNPPSDEYNLTRLPLDELPDVLSWCHQWIEILQSSVHILAQTSDARKSYTPEIEVSSSHAVAGPVHMPSPAPAAHDPSQSLPGPSTTAGSRMPKQSRLKKSRKSKQTSASRDLQSDNELGTGDSEGSSERGYDNLDPTSDDDDLNPNGFPAHSDLIGYDQTELTGSQSDTFIEQEGRIDGTMTLGRPLPRLSEDCSKIFTHGTSYIEYIIAITDLSCNVQ